MKSIKIKLLVSLVSLLLLSSANIGFSAETAIDRYTFMTENIPPFNFEKDGRMGGIAVELLDKAFKKMGAKKTLKDIKLVPWARAYQDVQRKEKTCLFSMVRTSQREHLFKWVGPIVPLRIVLIAKKSKKIKIRTLDDIRKYRVGVVNQDIGEQLLVKKGIKKKFLEKVHSQKLNILKLVNDRLDMCAYPEYSALWQIANLDLDPADYETVYVLDENYLFYAFHKNTPDSLIQQFQNALNEMKIDGTHQKILGDYINRGLPMPQRPMKFVYFDNYAPFSWFENGKIRGILVDVIDEAVRKQMGLPVLHQGLPWARAQNEVKQSKADAFVTVPTPERRTYTEISTEPLVEAQFTIFAKKDTPKIKDIRAVKTISDLRPFVQSQYMGNGWAKKKLADMNVLWESTMDFAINLLIADRADLFVGASPVVGYNVNRLGYNGRIIEIPNSLDSNSFNLCVGKNSPYKRILPEFNKTIKKMRQDGRLQKIYDKYKSSKQIVRMHVPIIEDSPNQHPFFHDLLFEAISEYGYNPFIIPVTAPQQRVKRSLDAGLISLFWLVASDERDKKYIPIEVGLTDGFIGKRILFITKGEQHRYNNVETLDDFRKLNLVGGMGKGWFDVKVWKANGLKYEEKDGNWKAIFKMLPHGRKYNYFSRGANEILLESRQYPDLEIEKRLMLVYDRDFKFYLARSGKNAVTQYEDILNKALKKARESGLIEKLVKKYWASDFETLNIENRVKIKLQTPE